MIKLTLTKSMAIMAFFTLPMPGKIIGAVFAALMQNVVLKRSVYILVFISGLILASKALIVADLNGLVWTLKPFLFIIGAGVGTYFIYVKDIEFSKIINIAAITCFLIMLVQFYFFDIWSGSGDYRGRPTAGLRGFGEYSILAFFFVRTKIGLSLSILVLLFSGSKSILLGIILGLLCVLLYRERKLRLKPFLFIGLIASILPVWNISSFLANDQVFAAFATSVIECSLDCNSFSNRINGSLDLFKSIYENPLRLFFGTEKADAFHVNPEIGIFFILKAGGIFLVLTIYGLIYGSLSGLKGRNLLVLIPMIDPYCLSPVSFIFFGFLSLVKHRLNKV